jgi:hypothetical protein
MSCVNYCTAGCSGGLCSIAQRFSASPRETKWLFVSSASAVKVLRRLPISRVMSTFRDAVAWIVALLGAVSIYESFGAVWLAGWTVGVMAFLHSRHWSGTFPGDGETRDAPWHAAPLRHEREDPEHRAGSKERGEVDGGTASTYGRDQVTQHPHRFDAAAGCADPGGSVLRQDSQGLNSSHTARPNAA